VSTNTSPGAIGGAGSLHANLLVPAVLVGDGIGVNRDRKVLVDSEVVRARDDARHDPLCDPDTVHETSDLAVDLDEIPGPNPQPPRGSVSAAGEFKTQTAGSAVQRKWLGLWRECSG